MPEGHTIHRIARDHTRLIAGGPVRVSSPQGRFSADASRVDGVVLERIEAYGKHLFYWWANGEVGHVHLGLFGKYRVHPGPTPPDPVGAVRMRLVGDRATIDLAGPTACTVGPADDRDTIVARLGPDPLRRDGRPAPFIERVRRSKQPIGALLLDQSIISGVGNVFRAEALFAEGIDPHRPGTATQDDELASLWDTISRMLRDGVRRNRIVTVDESVMPVPLDGHPHRGDGSRRSTSVYHRDRCLRCRTAIVTAELAGRPCYYCPTCQAG